MKKTKEEEKKQTKANKIIGIIINVLLVIVIIFAFFCTYTAFVTKNGSGVPNFLGVIPLSIQSNSMSPTFDEGDLIIDKEVKDPSTLKEGDIITFWTIIDGQKVLNTHRIVGIEDGGTFRYFYTKGDNNTVEDSMTVHESEVVGIYSTHIKGLGSVLDFLQTSKGFLLIIVIPVLAFFIYYLVSFFRTLLAYNGAKKKLEIEQEIEARNAETLANTKAMAATIITQSETGINTIKTENDSQTSEKTASVNGEGITLTKEQLLTLLSQAGVLPASTQETKSDTPAATRETKSDMPAATQETKSDTPATTQETKSDTDFSVDSLADSPTEPLREGKDTKSIVKDPFSNRPPRF